MKGRIAKQLRGGVAKMRRRIAEKIKRGVAKKGGRFTKQLRAGVAKMGGAPQNSAGGGSRNAAALYKAAGGV